VCVCVFWLPFSLITPVASGKWQQEGQELNTIQVGTELRTQVV